MKQSLFLFAFAAVVLPQTISAQNCPLSQGHGSVVITQQSSVSTCPSQRHQVIQRSAIISTPTVVGEQHFVNATATEEKKDIVSTAVAAGSFKTLSAALRAADLIDALQGKGPFTVFAPTDEAFAKLPEGTVAELLKPENKEKLVSILKLHVVSGKVTAKDVVKIESATTLEGSDLSVNVANNKVSIGGSNVVKTDIMCSNGVIHVIDSVILPAPKSASKSIVETAAGAEQFSTLVAAVRAGGLVETLSGEGPFTVFAPTNEAFAELPEGTLASLLKSENKEKLATILKYHVVSGNVMAADVIKLESAKTVAGESVNIKVENGTVMINGSKVTKADIKCGNGVIHIIDSVLIPDGK